MLVYKYYAIHEIRLYIITWYTYYCENYILIGLLLLYNIFMMKDIEKKVPTFVIALSALENIVVKI